MIVFNKNKFSGKTVTVTYCETSENHVGMEKIGSIAQRGFSIDELKRTYNMFSGLTTTHLVNLNDYLPAGIEVTEARLLIIRNGVNVLLNNVGKTVDDMFNEQFTFQWDSKYYDVRRSSVLNKHARYNVCYNDFSQEPDYENKKGKVINFNQVQCTNYIRQCLPVILGDHAKDLVAEGNLYYDVSKCGIGFHGDTERRKVVGVRLGESIPMHFQWYLVSERVGTMFQTMLQHGDLYVMSDKAVGNDWKKRSIYTLRHAAGCTKYTS